MTGRPTPRGRLAAERRWRHLPLLSHGFRPFFLGAAIHAAAAMGAWLALLHGATPVHPVHGMMAWHAHEMLFGFTPAVLAGFLFTAVPNWTGRMPITGWPLAALALLWAAGRIAMAGAAGPLAAAVIDASFLPAVLAVMLREVIAGRNWRNLMVLGPVAVLAVADIAFHVEAAAAGHPAFAIRLGFAAILFLLMLIGGRIIPSFTRNRLVKRGETRLPAAPGRFDILCLGAGAAAVTLWAIAPLAPVAAAALGIAALLSAARLSRWRGMATVADPLLFMLHLFWAMLPAGLILLAAAGLGADPGARVAGLHVLGIGAVGGMTLAVMMRASLGHTGRALVADGWMTLGALALLGAVLARGAAAFAPWAGWLTDLSALLWIFAFAGFALRFGPWLLRPRRAQEA